MNFNEINDIVAELAILRFYPADVSARLAIVRLVGEMASTVDQVRWLVRRMTTGLYNEWPGPRELRACFCSKFRPRDGLGACSQVYPDGIPSERSEPARLIEGPRMLPPGRVVSASPTLDSAVLALAAAKDLNRVGPRPRVRDIPIQQVAGSNRITQADIDRAVSENRDKKAREELQGESQ